MYQPLPQGIQQGAETEQGIPGPRGICSDRNCEAKYHLTELTTYTGNQNVLAHMTVA